MARAAYAFALANPNVSASVVEVQEFPDLARRYRVMGVPKTVINDVAEFSGAVPEETFLTAILQALGQPLAGEAPQAIPAEGPSSAI